MVSEVFYFASEYVQLKEKQYEQVSLCCWTICPIINLLWMPKGITLSHSMQWEKKHRQGLRRTSQYHLFATDQLRDHACNDFDDWQPNIHSFSIITPNQMITSNPGCI